MLGACSGAEAPVRQCTFGALARSRKQEVTSTTMYSMGTLDESRVIPYLSVAHTHTHTGSTHRSRST